MTSPKDQKADKGISSIPKICPSVENISVRNSCTAKLVPDVVSEEVIFCKINPGFCSAKIRGLVKENDVSILVPF